jgi:hypothetical protein
MSERRSRAASSVTMHRACHAHLFWVRVTNRKRRGLITRSRECLQEERGLRLRTWNVSECLAALRCVVSMLHMVFLNLTSNTLVPMKAVVLIPSSWSSLHVVSEMQKNAI